MVSESVVSEFAVFCLVPWCCHQFCRTDSELSGIKAACAVLLQFRLQDLVSAFGCRLNLMFVCILCALLIYVLWSVYIYIPLWERYSKLYVENQRNLALLKTMFLKIVNLFHNFIENVSTALRWASILIGSVMEKC